MLHGRPQFGSLVVRASVLACMLALPAAANHPQDFRSALEGLRANKMALVDRAFLKGANRDGADHLLDLYELGGLYQLNGNLKKSMEFFNTADSVAHDQEGRAVVSAGAAVRSAGAVLVNDTLLKYQGAGYDKVMSRTLNAVNYVLAGDLEGARVEVRKAEEYQRLERERTERELQKAARPPQGAESARLDNPSVQAAYGRMFDAVRKVRNSIENAYTYYLSSQIYLAQGEEGLNDALVEIKRAYQLAPQAAAVRAAYLEIAAAQGGAALDQARADLNAASDPAPPDLRGTGSVVVCYQAGLVPALEEVKLNLFAVNRLYSLAFPIYRDFGMTQPMLTLIPPAPAKPVATSTILETRLLALKALQERMPGILTRGLLGAVAKGEAQQKAEKDYGFLGGLITQVATIATTNADLRSWLSLPAEVQVAACHLQPGAAALTVAGPGWTESVPLTVTPGSHTFLFVRAMPGFKRIDAVTFGPDGNVAAPAPAAVAP